MQLGERLKTIASFVPIGARLADIGTDHAYLPVYLVKKQIIGYAVAADIVEGPFEAARQSVRAYRCEDKILVRQGDGLTVLAPGEVDTIIIAGMGGATIAGILAKNPEVARTAQKLILQPMGESANLRRFLYRQGWFIADEALVKDTGHLYQIIAAERGQTKELPDDLTLQIGPVLLQKQPALLGQHVQNIVAKYQHICSNMEKSAQAVQTQKYQQMKRLLEQAKELLSCLYK